MTTTNQTFEQALENFLCGAQMKVNETYNTPGQSRALSIAKGSRKYIKVVAKSVYNGIPEEHGSVYCFVEIETGNILKSASWNTPAKGVRGSIYAEDCGASAVTAYGANYNYR